MFGLCQSFAQPFFMANIGCKPECPYFFVPPQTVFRRYAALSSMLIFAVNISGLYRHIEKGRRLRNSRNFSL
jgi:hypothetical protein